MPNAYDVISQLLRRDSQNPPNPDLLEDFAVSFGWRVKDIVDGNSSRSALASTHLLVEQGLQNAALLTFISPQRTTFDFQGDERNELLSVSYNNLVDWHVWIEAERV